MTKIALRYWLPLFHPQRNPITFSKMRRLSKERKALAKLGTAALRDIGVTKNQAVVESKRAPWDAPDHWIR